MHLSMSITGIIEHISADESEENNIEFISFKQIIQKVYYSFIIGSMNISIILSFKSSFI